MELTVKFVDYGNEISVSKVDPHCGRSVASAVWSQRDQQRKSFSLILLTFSDSTDSQRFSLILLKSFSFQNNSELRTFTLLLF